MFHRVPNFPQSLPTDLSKIGFSMEFRMRTCGTGQAALTKASSQGTLHQTQAELESTKEGSGSAAPKSHAMRLSIGVRSGADSVPATAISAGALV
jgi:hypothetical protein